MKISVQDTKKCKQFQILFQLMYNLCEEVNMYFKNDKLFIQGMDTGHICLFELHITKEWFKCYEITRDQEVFGVNLKILSKILSCWKEGQTITVDNPKEDKLMFHFESKELYKGFEMGLFDYDTEILSIPDVEYDVDVNLNSKMFSSLISELDSFGDVVEIHSTNDYINFKTKQNTFETQVENRLNVSDLEGYSIIEEEEVKVDMSLQYMLNVVQFSRIAKEVDINMSKNYPMKFTYKLEENDYISIWVSPRMEDD